MLLLLSKMSNLLYFFSFLLEKVVIYWQKMIKIIKIIDYQYFLFTFNLERFTGDYIIFTGKNNKFTGKK